MLKSLFSSGNGEPQVCGCGGCICDASCRAAETRESARDLVVARGRPL